jgi:hypothetical protein
VDIRLSANAALPTFTLRREPLSMHWLLESITDGDWASDWRKGTTLW